jgi:hypothetical protein
LTFLDVSDNVHMTTVESSALTDLKALDKVIFDGCSQLKIFERDSLSRDGSGDDDGKVLRISLRHMGWKRPPRSLFEGVARGSNVEINLDGNPIKCDCQAHDLQSFLAGLSNGTRAECASPTLHFGKQLVEVAPAELICGGDDDDDEDDEVLLDVSGAQGNLGDGEERSSFDEGAPLTSDQKV